MKPLRDIVEELAPKRLILPLGLLLGSMFLLVNPPYAVNDEDVHMARMYELASGRLLTLSDDTREYHMVPADYAELGANYQTIAQRKGGRIKLPEVWRDLTRPKPEGPLVPMTARASGYAPVAYGLQLPVIWLAKHTSLGAMAHLYLARIASLVVYVLLAWRAVLAAGSLRWLFFLTALLPMALTQAAGVSADGLVIGLSLLIFALVAKGGILQQKLSAWELTALVASLTLLGVCKAVYAVVGLSLFTLRWDGPRAQLWRWAFAVGACAVTAACTLAWLRAHSVVGADVLETRNPSTQLQWLLADPSRTARWALDNALWHVDNLLIESTFVRYRISHGMRFAGALGGALCAQLLLGAAWGAARHRSTQTLWERRLSTFLFAATWLALLLCIPTALYLCCNRLGAPELRGFHGRYLIPAIPPLLLACSLLGRPLWARWLRLRRGLAIGALVAVNLMSQFSLIGWHYFPPIEWPL